MDRNVKQLEYVSPQIKYENGPKDIFSTWISFIVGSVLLTPRRC